MSLELATICLQSIIILIALLAVFRGSKFMLGFVVAFGIYLYFNLALYYSWHFKLLGDSGQSILMFVAAACATFSIWEVYRN